MEYTWAIVLLFLCFVDNTWARKGGYDSCKWTEWTDYGPCHCQEKERESTRRCIEEGCCPGGKLNLQQRYLYCECTTTTTTTTSTTTTTTPQPTTTSTTTTTTPEPTTTTSTTTTTTPDPTTTTSTTTTTTPEPTTTTSTTTTTTPEPTTTTSTTTTTTPEPTTTTSTSTTTTPYPTTTTSTTTTPRPTTTTTSEPTTTTSTPEPTTTSTPEPTTTSTPEPTTTTSSTTTTTLEPTTTTSTTTTTTPEPTTTTSTTSTPEPTTTTSTSTTTTTPEPTTTSTTTTTLEPTTTTSTTTTPNPTTTSTTTTTTLPFTTTEVTDPPKPPGKGKWYINETLELPHVQAGMLVYTLDNSTRGIIECQLRQGNVTFYLSSDGSIRLVTDTLGSGNYYLMIECYSDVFHLWLNIIRPFLQTSTPSASKDTDLISLLIPALLSLLALLLLIFIIVFRWLKRKKKKPLHDPNRRETILGDQFVFTPPRRFIYPVERFSGYERHLPLDLNTKRTDMGALREMSRAGSITPVMYLQTPDIDEELGQYWIPAATEWQQAWDNDAKSPFPSRPTSRFASRPATAKSRKPSIFVEDASSINSDSVIAEVTDLTPSVPIRSASMMMNYSHVDPEGNGSIDHEQQGEAFMRGPNGALSSESNRPPTSANNGIATVIEERVSEMQDKSGEATSRSSTRMSLRATSARSTRELSSAKREREVTSPDGRVTSVSALGLTEEISASRADSPAKFKTGMQVLLGDDANDDSAIRMKTGSAKRVTSPEEGPLPLLRPMSGRPLSRISETGSQSQIAESESFKLRGGKLLTLAGEEVFVGEDGKPTHYITKTGKRKSISITPGGNLLTRDGIPIHLNSSLTTTLPAGSTRKDLVLVDDDGAPVDLSRPDGRPTPLYTGKGESVVIVPDTKIIHVIRPDGEPEEVRISPRGDKLISRAGEIIDLYDTDGRPVSVRPPSAHQEICKQRMVLVDENGVSLPQNTSLVTQNGQKVFTDHQGLPVHIINENGEVIPVTHNGSHFVSPTGNPVQFATENGGLVNLQPLPPTQLPKSKDCAGDTSRLESVKPVLLRADGVPLANTSETLVLTEDGHRVVMGADGVPTHVVSTNGSTIPIEYNGDEFVTPDENPLSFITSDGTSLNTIPDKEELPTSKQRSTKQQIRNKKGDHKRKHALRDSDGELVSNASEPVFTANGQAVFIDASGVPTHITANDGTMIPVIHDGSCFVTPGGHQIKFQTSDGRPVQIEPPLDDRLAKSQPETQHLDEELKPVLVDSNGVPLQHTRIPVFTDSGQQVVLDHDGLPTHIIHNNGEVIPITHNDVEFVTSDGEPVVLTTADGKLVYSEPGFLHRPAKRPTTATRRRIRRELNLINEELSEETLETINPDDQPVQFIDTDGEVLHVSDGPGGEVKLFDGKGEIVHTVGAEGNVPTEGSSVVTPALNVSFNASSLDAYPERSSSSQDDYVERRRPDSSVSRRCSTESARSVFSSRDQSPTTNTLVETERRVSEHTIFSSLTRTATTYSIDQSAEPILPNELRRRKLPTPESPENIDDQEQFFEKGARPVTRMIRSEQLETYDSESIDSDNDYSRYTDPLTARNIEIEPYDEGQSDRGRSILRSNSESRSQSRNSSCEFHDRSFDEETTLRGAEPMTGIDTTERTPRKRKNKKKPYESPYRMVKFNEDNLEMRYRIPNPSDLSEASIRMLSRDPTQENMITDAEGVNYYYSEFLDQYYRHILDEVHANHPTYRRKYMRHIDSSNSNDAIQSPDELDSQPIMAPDRSDFVNEIYRRRSSIRNIMSKQESSSQRLSSGHLCERVANAHRSPEEVRRAQKAKEKKKNQERAKRAPDPQKKVAARYLDFYFKSAEAKPEPETTVIPDTKPKISKGTKALLRAKAKAKKAANSILPAISNNDNSINKPAPDSKSKVEKTPKIAEAAREIERARSSKTSSLYRPTTAIEKELYEMKTLVKEFSFERKRNRYS